MMENKKSYTLKVFLQDGIKISIALPYDEIVRYITEVATKKLQACKGHFTFKNNDNIVTLRHKQSIHYFVVSNNDEIIIEYDNIPNKFLYWTIDHKNVL